MDWVWHFLISDSRHQLHDPLVPFSCCRWVATGRVVINSLALNIRIRLRITMEALDLLMPPNGFWFKLSLLFLSSFWSLHPFSVIFMISPIHAIFSPVVVCLSSHVKVRCLIFAAHRFVFWTFIFISHVRYVNVQFAFILSTLRRVRGLPQIRHVGRHIVYYTTFHIF